MIEGGSESRNWPADWCSLCSGAHTVLVIVVQKEQSIKVKKSVYLLIDKPTLTFSRELWVVTESSSESEYSHCSLLYRKNPPEEVNPISKINQYIQLAAEKHIKMQLYVWYQFYLDKYILIPKFHINANSHNVFHKDVNFFNNN